MTLKKRFETILHDLKPVEPSPGLRGRILARIHTREVAAARVRFWLSLAACIGSLAMFVPAFQFTAREFALSGFSQYLSLILTDGNFMIIYWKEFAFSLLESLPIVGIIATLSVAFVFLGSLAVIMRNARSIFIPAGAY